MTPVFLLRYLYSGKAILQNEGYLLHHVFVLFRYIIYAYAYIIYLISSYFKGLSLVPTKTDLFQIMIKAGHIARVLNKNDISSDTTISRQMILLPGYSGYCVLMGASLITVRHGYQASNFQLCLCHFSSPQILHL